MSELKTKKSRKWIVFVIAGVVLAIIVVVAFFFISHAVKTSRAKAELHTAEKYLADLDYKEAIAHYKEVIEIDPANVEAYLGIAEAYNALATEAIAEMNFGLAIRYYKEAINILREGTSYVDSDEIDEWIDQFREDKEAAEEQKKAEEGDSENTSGETEAGENQTGQDSVEEMIVDDSDIWKELYLAELQNNYGYYSNHSDTTYDYDVVRAALYDINEDEIPEMIVCESGDVYMNGDFVSLYTVDSGILYANRDMTFVEWTVWGGYCLDSSHIRIRSGGADSTNQRIITMENNSFIVSEILTADYGIDGHVGDDNSELNDYLEYHYSSIYGIDYVTRKYFHSDIDVTPYPDDSYFNYPMYDDSNHKFEWIDIDIMIEYLAQ